MERKRVAEEFLESCYFLFIIEFEEPVNELTKPTFEAGRPFRRRFTSFLKEDAARRGILKLDEYIGRILGVANHQIARKIAEQIQFMSKKIIADNVRMIGAEKGG